MISTGRKYRFRGPAEVCSREILLPVPTANVGSAFPYALMWQVQALLSGVERSNQNVSIDNFARIAKGLDTEPWKLLKDD